MNEESEYLSKGPCDECGSSDANAAYTDGHTYCFSCGHRGKSGEDIQDTREHRMSEFNPTYIEYPDQGIRGIRKDTLQKFTYGASKGKHVTYFYDTMGNIVAEKYRMPDKQFAWSGNSKESTLFGQQLWKPNKKISITITEGEIDAMSISQMQQNKYPVVSVPSGANGAKREVRKQLEWLLGFKEVVLCFDNDKAGQAAVQEVAALFPPKFVRIAQLPLKDANDMIKNNRSFELSNALRDAKHYTPDGILQGNGIIDRLMNERELESFPFPDFLPITNDRTKGFRFGELITITAGTSSGKTTLFKQLQYHIFTNTKLNQALIHLEEPLEHTAKDLIGISMETRLQLRDDFDKEVMLSKARELFEAVDDIGNYRLNLYDSFGSMSSEDLFNKIRFMVNGLDCKVIFLDHLSILVSGMDLSGDERRTIDFLMTELKSLAIELDCVIFLVSHLNNNTDKPFEEGGRITINNLRGSAAIKQLSDGVIAISRNQQDEDEVARNTTQVSLLKWRYTGLTGLTDRIFYNGFTGRFQAAEVKTEEEDGDF